MNAWRFAVALLSLALGCMGDPRAPASPAPVATASPSPPEPQAPAEPVIWSPQVAVLDGELLAGLEERGFRLGRLVAGSAADTNEELSRIPAFESIFAALRGDVKEVARFYPNARVTTIDGFRLFDVTALSSKEMSFELVGAFNRLDRKVFYQGSCGETRFVYRLRYSTIQGGEPMSGRLPMTVNVVFLVDDQGGCRDVARALQTQGDAEALVAKDGPFGESMRARWTLKSVETNLQTIRLQSSVHTTMGGHIEYSLRVFHPQGESMVPAPMENMPSLAARSGTVRSELLAYLKQKDVLAAIDQGTLRVPDQFLATSATSVAPRGLTRLANRPYSGIFSAADFKDLDLSSYRTIQSPKALLRRLDEATCVGCHQSRSIAGFHFVGEDNKDTPAFKSLYSGLSSHLRADLDRRTAYAVAIASEQIPDEMRPIPERQGVGNEYGAPCSLGDEGFSDWQCAAGFRCHKLEDPEIGVCFPEEGAGLGAPCEYGEVHPRLDARKDFVSALTAKGCPKHMGCAGNPSGFPLGACGAQCSAFEDAPCVDFLDVDGFQNCLRFRYSHDACAKRYVIPTATHACDETHACRQDYVCVRSQSPGMGSCVPPYFVYPLRLDGVAGAPERR